MGGGGDTGGAPREGATLPRDKRIERDRIPAQGIGLSLRDEELKLLSAVGRFRVVSTKDLSETIYGGRSSRLQRDLAFLRDHKLVEVRASTKPPKKDKIRGTRTFG